MKYSIRIDNVEVQGEDAMVVFEIAKVLWPNRILNNLELQINESKDIKMVEIKRNNKSNKDA